MSPYSSQAVTIVVVGEGAWWWVRAWWVAVVVVRDEGADGVGGGGVTTRLAVVIIIRMMNGDTPQAPSPRVDRSWLKRSDVYRSSTQNADATTLCTPKVNDISLSILTIATPGDRGLSHL
jgi:hypothetical protein